MITRVSWVVGVFMRGLDEDDDERCVGNAGTISTASADEDENDDTDVDDAD